MTTIKRFWFYAFALIGATFMLFSSCEKEEVPVLTTTDVTEITQTTATTGGNITDDGGATVTARGVCWSTSQNPTIKDGHTKDGTGIGNFTSSISGIMPNTTYYVRTYATNGAGTGYGSTVTFTTLEGLTPTLETTDVSNITQTAATSGGNITEDRGAPVTLRGVCWSMSQNPTINDSKTINGNGSGSFTSSITGLEPNTTYYVKAYATNISGTGYGSAVTFTTPEAIAPTISTRKISNITQATAISGGTIADDGGAPVTLRGVCWSMSQNPTINDSKTIDGTGSGSFTSSISSLEPKTKYYLRAYATNSVGTSYGEQLEFNTYYGSVNDIDNNTYYTILIGEQEWIAENLKTSKYKDGTPIPTGLDNVQWLQDTSGAYTIYSHNLIDGLNSDAEVLKAYGALYNWFAVETDNLCPTGWRVPTMEDWNTLVNFLVSQGYPNNNEVGAAGNALKSCRQVSSPLGGNCVTSQHPRWNLDNTHYGTDVFGFSALPGGYSGAAYTGNNFYKIGLDCSLWSSTEYHDADASHIIISYYRGFVSRTFSSKVIGLSVRCLRDN